MAGPVGWATGCWVVGLASACQNTRTGTLVCLVHWLAAMEGTVERAQRRARQLLVQLTHARARTEAWKHSTFAARSLAGRSWRAD